ncbi:MAG: hypothetical protein M1828_002889 [Chrysothrix sp. TS-e1954]|nr:MAG: hypothetical protein M1828_002889 [Chrysothrix sp. TS-e1954]
MSRQRDDRFYKRERGAKQPRGFREISVTPTGYQDSDSEADRIQSFRNNLTCLSKYHNLYFVANDDKIQIFEPEYPTQRFPTTPSMVLELPRSAPDLDGFMPGNPHAINHLRIAELGTEEIVVCACNDGDVIAFKTDHVMDEVRYERRLKQDGFDLPVSAKPFFHENVGASAWGLDVHKEARMIAVSCNTHVVNVFAFALEQQSACSSTSMDSGSAERTNLSADALQQVPGVSTIVPNIDNSTHVSPDSLGSDMSSLLSSDHSTDCISDWRIASYEQPIDGLLQTRTENVRILLEHHENNVPAVAFCNTEEDTLGQYLISTDIEGETILWDVGLARIMQRVKAPRPHFAQHLAGFNAWGAGWGALWIDKRAFQETRAVSEAIGCGQYFRKPDACAIDLTCSLESLRDSGAWNLQPQISGQHQNAVIESAASEDSDESESDDSEDETVAFPESRVSSESEDAVSMTRVPTLAKANESLEDATQSRRWPDFAMNRESGWTIDHWAAKNPRPEGDALLTPPATPCMLLSVKSWQLFQTGRFAPSEPAAPIVTLGNLLNQVTSPPFANLDHFDRLNLYTQIPELGVVLVGSGIGRVAILTCHALEPNPICTRPTADVLYTLRLDWILPFSSQEQKGQRPLQQLVGIAVGPVQGREGDRVESPRKWRVLLTYRDRTTFAYEIGNDDGGTSAEVLLV